MKTVVRDDKYRRVTDEMATKLVNQGWKYTNKSLWKENVRDAKRKGKK